MAQKTIDNGPMLAVEAPADLGFPFYISPKYDGIRSVIRDGEAFTRSLKAVPNHYVREYFSCGSYDGLDGELMVGNPVAEDVFNTTTRGVMKREGEPDFQFYVFDYWNGSAHTTDYETRLERLRVGIDSMPTYLQSRVVVVPQILVYDIDHLAAVEQANVDAGYEGSMLRRPVGGYKFGRSTAKEGYLLKMKRFVDGEAIIIGFQEMFSNQNEAFIGELGQTKRSTHQENKVALGSLGALLVRDIRTGVEFSIGSGFNNDQRDWFWANRHLLMGVMVKYKYFPVGVKDKPRFPIFLGLRNWRDMPVGYSPTAADLQSPV